MNEEITSIIGRTAAGLSGAFIAVIMPWQHEAEAWMRLIGGALGIIVAILSAISIAITIRKNLK